MSITTNYRVTVQSFGAYPRGSILPAWAVERAGPIAEQVARGIVEPTELPVNVDVRVPDEVKPADPNPDLVLEVNKLRSANEQLVLDAKAYQETAEAYKRDIVSRDRALGELTAERDRWRASAERLEKAMEEAKATNAKLAAELAELDQLTAPAASAAA